MILEETVLPALLKDPLDISKTIYRRLSEWSYAYLYSFQHHLQSINMKEVQLLNGDDLIREMLCLH